MNNYRGENISTKKIFMKIILKITYLNEFSFSDIAIGAPYDGPNGKGAVYIYLGSIDGVMDKHSQVQIWCNNVIK